MRVVLMTVFLFLYLLVTTARAETTVLVDPTTVLKVPPLLCVYKVSHWDGPKDVMRSTIYFVSIKTCNKIRDARGLPPIDPLKRKKKKEPSIELPDKKSKTRLLL